MYHGAVAVVQELHEVGATEVADIQALGVMNDETLRTLTDSIVRNTRLGGASENKLQELEKEMSDFIEEQAKK